MADEFILETHGLTKEFAGFFAVRDVALKVRRGSIHALIGPNGAGKTTCFNLLTKFLKPSAGQILYKGKDITAMAPADVARLGLVRSFQISAVFPHLTALENVRVALHADLLQLLQAEGDLRGVIAVDQDHHPVKARHPLKRIDPVAGASEHAAIRVFEVLRNGDARIEQPGARGVGQAQAHDGLGTLDPLFHPLGEFAPHRGQLASRLR
ncbi:MAG: ATP-binding cassette domain-containing protein, partial [Bradyrhizobium sp.]